MYVSVRLNCELQMFLEVLLDDDTLLLLLHLTV